MNTVKDLRLKNGLTQEELAEKIGVHVQTVWAWENGKNNPKGKRLRDLAEFFHVSEADIQNPKLESLFLASFPLAFLSKLLRTSSTTKIYLENGTANISVLKSMATRCLQNISTEIRSS